MRPETDVASLARSARDTLRNALTATLLVEGIGRVSTDTDVLLHDNDGRPTFLCPPGGPLPAAAQAVAPAVLSVSVFDRRAAPVGAVIFAGQLASVGVEDVDGTAVAVVELVLASVIVECDDPESPTVLARRVPLEHYGRPPAADLAPAAEMIRTHTNRCHEAQLRAFVADRTAVPAELIAGATLAALDECGAELHWVDERGAHRAVLPFPRAARSHRDLALLLRTELCAVDR